MRAGYRLNAAAIVAAMVVPAAAWAAQEQPSSQMAGVAQAAVTGCAQAHSMAERTIEMTNRRLEAARQANSPAAMRAAMDDLQGALRQLRTDIAPCAALHPNAAAALGAPGLESPAADPHVGHVLPGAAQTPGNTTITLRTIPTPALGAAENQFEVTVNDRQGRPVDGADVSLLFYMPAMPAMKMPEMRNEVKLKGTGGGTYAGAGQVMMAGSWTVTVSVKRNGKEVSQQNVTVTAK